MQLNSRIYGSVKRYPERIVQFGEGNFLRAFLDWMIAEMNEKAGFNSSVVIIQPIAIGNVDKLNEQEGLYTLYMRGIKNDMAVSEHKIVDSISRGINPYTEYDKYLTVAENPDVRFIVSNTTEAGIAFNEKDSPNDRPQNTFPAKLTSFLYHRYQFFKGDNTKGLIVIPCELIDRNGEQLKQCILRYSKLWGFEKEFINWLNEANIFCNSLVDRIVTGYPKERKQEIEKELGYSDQMLVETEQYYLWVIEGPHKVQDEFPAHLAGLNVLFVDDMTPYRTRKVRILNGAHSSMTPIAFLCGLHTVKEAIDHPVVGRYMQDLIFQEIIPSIEPGCEELSFYALEVIQRFRNPYIRHNLASIALNSMSKYRVRVLPSLLEYQNRTAQLPKKLVFSLAALLVFYRGKNGEETYSISDDNHNLELLSGLWSTCDGSAKHLQQLVEKVMGAQQIWGQDLNQVEGLTEMTARFLVKIVLEGMEKSLSEVL